MIFHRKIVPRMHSWWIFAASLSCCIALADNVGNCIWYDECGSASSTGDPKNCNYTGPAKLLKSEGFELFYQLCPGLVAEFGRTPALCCNAAQLRSLDRGLATARQILGRCPACFSNFVR